MAGSSSSLPRARLDLLLCFVIASVGVAFQHQPFLRVEQQRMLPSSPPCASSFHRHRKGGVELHFKVAFDDVALGVKRAVKALDEGRKAFDEEVWDLFQGAKERKWSPDRRPDNMKGVAAGPSEDSQLTWGGAKSLEIYNKMIDEWSENKQIMSGAALGSAAVTVVGESGKLSVDETEEELKRFRAFQAPQLGSNSRKIDSAVELAELVRNKYGRYHDVAILRNTGQTAFNIYAPHLSQGSFPYTEGQYLEKLNIIVAMLNDFDQAWYVKQFLLSPIVPRNGLPSTPRFDTAVTLRLNLSPTWKDVDQKIVEEWFSLPGIQSGG